MITATQSMNQISERKEVDKQEFAWDPSDCDCDCDSKQEVVEELVEKLTWKPSSVTETETKTEPKKLSKTANNSDRAPCPKKKGNRNSNSNIKSSSTANACTDRTVISIDKMTEQDTTTDVDADADADVVPSVSDAQKEKEKQKQAQTTASITSNGNTPADSKKVKKSSKKPSSSSPTKTTPFKRDVPWDANDQDFDSDGEWGVDDFGKDSPGVWDPDTLKKQTGELDPWKEAAKSPARIQDLPSPALADPPPEVRKSNSDEEEWPFKSPCAFKAKKGRSLTPRSAQSASASAASSAASSDMDSQTSSSGKTAEADAEAKSSRDNDVGRSGGSDDDDDDDNDNDDGEDAGEKGDAPVEAWRKREIWKAASSANDAGDQQDPPPQEEDTRKNSSAKSKDSGPTMPSRGSRSRTDADNGDGDANDNDQAPAKLKNRKAKDPSGDQAGDGDEDDVGKPIKPKRRSKPEPSDDDELKKGGSFHSLVKDADKVRTKSKERRSKTLRGGRRRQLKESSPTVDSLDNSNNANDDDDEEFADDIVIKLAREEDEEPTSSRKKSWRDRRSDNRENRERSLSADGSAGEEVPTKAHTPTSGRRPPSSRRALMRRAHSERWRKAVEGPDDLGATLDSETIQRRARASLLNANAELSRSAHSARRFNGGSGGQEGRSRSFHAENAAKNTRAARKAHSSDALGTASYHREFDSYDMNRSGHSLDSIEDLEDFEHIDFQTPGMVDYEEEIHGLMQRANPENTAQLNRRVHRRRENVTYDQNMPMMTRQALLTRQAGSQVARGRVDPSGIDRGRLELKNSFHEKKDALSLSNHRGRFTPGRRAPPRTRSSTVVGSMRPTEVPSFMQQQPQDASDDRDRRGVFRSRSSTQTPSFRQYLNKPNKIAQLSSRRPPSASGGEAIDRHSSRGAPSEPVERRGMLQRAKSTTALRRPVRTDPREVTPNRDEIKRTAEPRAGTDDMPGLKPTRTKDVMDEDSDIESDDSSVDSMAEDLTSPKRPVKIKAPKSTPPTVIKSPSPKKKVFDKRDFTVERNRRKLHSMMYEQKMGLTMKDLLQQVKNGDPIKSPKSPVKAAASP
jgi:hypothetical protein